MSRFSLNDEDLDYLNDFVKSGTKSARELTRGRILLLAHAGKTENEIKDILGICRATVSNIKKRYRTEGLESALKDKPRPGQPPKYTARHEAEIVALACSDSPEGTKRWSLSLLVNELRRSEEFESITRESVRLVLKKTRQNHG